MGRLRWMQNVRTSDFEEGTLIQDGKYLYFGDENSYIYNSDSGTLVIYATTLSLTGAIAPSSLDLSSSTLTQGIANALIGIGTASSAKSVTITDDYVPLQVYVKAVDGNVDKTLAACYLKTGIETKDLSSLQACGVLARVALKYDCDSAYGVQSHIGINADMATGASHANIAAISGKIDLDNSVTQGDVQAGLFVLEAASGKTVTENSYGVQICFEENSVGTSGLALTGSGECTNAIDLGIRTTAYSINFNTPSTAVMKFVDDGTIASDANGSVLADISATANAGFLKVVVGSATKYIALYNTKTS